MNKVLIVEDEDIIRKGLMFMAKWSQYDCVVVGEAIKQGKVHNSDVYTVNENSWAQKFPGSSLMFLDLNKQVTVGELMRGLIIVSGNDAAVALAEHTSGSQASSLMK